MNILTFPQSDSSLIESNSLIEANNLDEIKKIPLRLVFLGNVDSGKTTLVSVLSKNCLDNGKGSARASIFKHPHEKNSGRTSSIAMEFCKINKRRSILIDLCGHERYLKTTLFGLNLSKPDYCLLIIGANMGISKMTLEHITMAVSLGYRIIICITKVDISPKHVTENTIKSIVHILEKYGKKVVILNPYRISKIEPNELNNIVDNQVPLISLSNVKGNGIGKLKSLLTRLPAIRTYNKNGETEFAVDDHFNLKGIGLVLSGTILKGSLAIGDKLELGTDKNNNFAAIEVKTIYFEDQPVKLLTAGQHCTMSIKISNINSRKTNKNNKNKKKIQQLSIRKGMVAVDPKLVEIGKARRFKANIHILHHQTTIRDCRETTDGRGYQSIVHCNGVRQSAEITKIYNEEGYIRSGDKVAAEFRFLYHDEYLTLNETFIFREGRSRGIGTITEIIK